MKNKGRFNYYKILIELFLIIIAGIWIIPAVTAVETSLRVKGIQNYLLIFTTKIEDMLIFPRMALNSAVITSVSLFLILLTSILAAFAFSKLHFKGKTFFYIAILSCFAIPIISTLIPNSILVIALGIRNTYAPMILLLVTANLPLSIMIFRGNFDGIADSYLEAANIDGSTNLNTMMKIIIPMSKPAIVNVLVVMFIQVWNDFQIPLIFATKPNLYTLTLAPSFYGLTQNRLDLPPLYASIIVIAVPVIIFYIVMQDKIIKGMTLGGIKE
jgi:ABC-type glycerol-3-phosphate transport system permease component